jgi:hypothetical protein
VLQCTVGLKKKVNEKSRAKTNNGTHDVKVVCDECQEDNGKMGNY